MTASEMRSIGRPFDGREVYKGMNYPCDLCGGSRHVRANEHYDGPIWLCPRCKDHVFYQSEKLGDILKNFLIGNAV